MQFLPRFAALAALLSSVGCATFDVPWFDRVPEASAKNPVVKVLCMWEPAEGRDPHGLPCRGFAGQILFLGNKGGVPVKVHGDVKIYVFDDFGTPEEQSVPVHQFAFDDRAWNNHLKVGTFGPAYYVFVPYTRHGNHEANCAVRIKYTPTEGIPIYSESCTINLKGKTRGFSASETEAIEPSAVERRVTTIPLRHDGDQPSISPLNVERANLLLEEFLWKKHNENLQERAPVRSEDLPGQ